MNNPLNMNNLRYRHWNLKFFKVIIREQVTHNTHAISSYCGTISAYRTYILYILFFLIGSLDIDVDAHVL